MKNASKKGWQVLIPVLLLLSMFAPQPAAFSAATEPAVICPAPNVSITEQTLTSIHFAWDQVSGGAVYRVWYVRQEDNYTSSQVTTGGNSISFSGLPAGTYDFYFVTVCTGETSTNYIFEDILMD